MTGFSLEMTRVIYDDKTGEKVAVVSPDSDTLGLVQIKDERGVTMVFHPTAARLLAKAVGACANEMEHERLDTKSCG